MALQRQSKLITIYHLLFTLAVAGCAWFEDKEARFLHSAEGRSTQEEVQQELGPPVMTKTTASGHAIWVYQIRTQQPGSRMNAPGTWCDEYVLTFDTRHILKDWTHREYFHGGENKPTYCVPGGMDGKP